MRSRGAGGQVSPLHVPVYQFRRLTYSTSTRPNQLSGSPTFLPVSQSRCRIHVVSTKIGIGHGRFSEPVCQRGNIKKRSRGRGRVGGVRLKEPVGGIKSGHTISPRSADRSGWILKADVQDRITDHRINVSWGNIGEIVDGEGFINIINDLRRDFRDRRLDNLMEGEDDIDE